MGLFSKLFKGDARDKEVAAPKEAKPEAAAPVEAPDQAKAAIEIDTPVAMPVFVPPAARATPVDAFERATVVAEASPFENERPTMVTPEPVAKALVQATARTSTPQVPVAKPAVPKPPAPKPPSPAAKKAPPAKAQSPATSGAPGLMKVDLSEVHALFGQLATNHLRQLRDFVIELRWGPTPSTWIAVCEPSLHSLLKAAEAIEFTALVSGLRVLAEAMTAADPTRVTTVEGPARERILSAHRFLEQLLPDTFALDADRSVREATILHTLLSQIPDVGKVTIDKLYAAGVTTLDAMLLATAEDLVASTAIPDVLARRIANRLREYREEMATARIDANRTHERGKIAALVTELREQNVAFERAAAAWTEEAIQKKKDVLAARAQTMLAIDLQLARLGEIALVRELERLPFARKLEALDAFLAKPEDQR